MQTIPSVPSVPSVAFVLVTTTTIAPMKPGDEITITPTELVAGGAALARVDGLPVFVSGLYPGDVAVVRITEAKKGFTRGELVRLLEPSALRRALPCPVADECGGCDWTALRLDAQLRAKERILRESLRRIGKIDPASLPPIAVHPSPLNYRLRSRLHRDGNDIGFFATRSNRVVPLSSECEVVGVETARTVGSGASNVAGTRSSASAAHDGGADALLRVPTTSTDLEIWELHGQLITDQREITIPVEDFTFTLSTDSFFQVNRHLLGTMLRLVRQHAERCPEKTSAIDLYAGAGFFTAPLARIFDRVTAVEGSAVSARWAKRNTSANVRIVNQPVEQYANQMARADFVFLDPPRSGVRTNVIESIAERAGSMICFLACDPVTFSRDASRLIASGWRLSTLDLLDLFPNTHHVETLSSFERAP